MKLIKLVGFFWIYTIVAQADVKINSVFGNHMVLQRNKPVSIWGKAKPGEKISVRFGDLIVKGKANADSTWKIILPAQNAGGPHLIKVKGNNELTFNDIFFGDVWIASGQSNMEWKFKQGVNNGPMEISLANYPLIRFIDVQNNPSSEPKTDFQSKGWNVCSSQSVLDFSAVAYFFAREVFQKTNVPIGIIQCEWGGTPAEAWTSKVALEAFPEFKETIADLKNAEVNGPNSTAFQALLLAFNQSLISHDEGTQKQWWKTELPSTESDWKTMNLPGYLEKTTLGDFDGAVWFRKEFALDDESQLEKDLFVRLGKIDDMDSTWLNGIKIGGARGKDRNRNYSIPKGVLKPGKNVIAVRLIDWGGSGGFWGENEAIQIGGNNFNPIQLSGEWKFKTGAAMKNLVTLGDEKRLFYMPTTLYNGMLAPLFPLSIQGVIWYQGESNAGKAKQYQTLFPTMIKDWRTKFSQGDFPFYFVQLANFMKPEAEPIQSNWAELREAQTMTLSLPNTGMALAIDVGEANDIHPKNKQDVGMRLALLALNKTYGLQIPSESPQFEKAEISGSNIKVGFKNVYNGLNVKDKYGYVKGFAIAGADKIFHWANAKLEGNQVFVSSPKVAEPKFVRYGWANNPDDANLYNSAGLPACPFRTDQ